MAKPYVKRTKAGVSTDLIDAYRAELRDGAGEVAGSLSAAQVCEIALESATKLRQGHYDKQLTDQMYAKVNRVIAEHIAATVAEILPNVTASTTPEGWPMIVVQQEDMSVMRFKMKDEFIRPAAPTVQ